MNARIEITGGAHAPCVRWLTPPAPPGERNGAYCSDGAARSEARGARARPS